MNTEEILKESNYSLFPHLTLVAYKSGNGDFYFEMHKIGNDGKMLAGVPLTEKCITEIAKSFSKIKDSENKTAYGAIPENVVYWDQRPGKTKLIWHNPPQKRMMYFSKSLHMEDREYCVPGIIYEVNGSLKVYAYKGKKLNPKTKLYRAPFFNVSTTNVCTGNAKTPYPKDLTYQNIIDYWERVFWLTEFSHLGGNGNPTKNNLISVTKNSIDSFNEDELIAIKKGRKILTFSDILTI